MHTITAMRKDLAHEERNILRMSLSMHVHTSKPKAVMTATSVPSVHALSSLACRDVQANGLGLEILKVIQAQLGEAGQLVRDRLARNAHASRYDIPVKAPSPTASLGALL